ncbi:hypothetical protein ACWDYJ_35385 [Streptomyces sp. NPDC003042]
MTRRRSGALSSAWALALLLAVLTAGCSGTQERVGREVFLDAATRLAGEPAIRYSAGVGGAELEMSATRYGTALGAFSLAGMRLDVLAVDGRSYSRRAQDPDGGGPGRLLPEETVQWTTVATQQGPDSFQLTPHDLGTMAAEALRTPGTLYPGRGQTTTVDGEATWKASTSTMDVHVTRATPHRLVRLTPKGAAAVPPPPTPPAFPTFPDPPPAPPTAPAPPPSPPAPPELPGLQLLDHVGGTLGRSIARTHPYTPPARAIPLPRPRPPLPGRTTIAPLSSRQVGALSQAVAKSAGQLSQAVNSAYQFTVRGTASFTGCGPGACTVTVRVNSAFVTQGARGPGNVRVRLRAEMTGAGSPVGSCTASGTLPVNGTGSLSCTNTSSAWASWYRGAELSEGAEPFQAIAHVVAQAMDPGEVTAVRDQVDKQFRNLSREIEGNKDCRRPLAAAPMRHAVYLTVTPLGPWDHLCPYVLPPEIKGIPAFDARSIDLVRKIHFPNGEQTDNTKGQFLSTLKDADLHKILETGLLDSSKPFKLNTKGYWEKSFPCPGKGHDAMVNGKRQPARSVMVVINTAADIVTMYPHN